MCGYRDDQYAVPQPGSLYKNSYTRSQLLPSQITFQLQFLFHLTSISGTFLPSAHTSPFSGFVWTLDCSFSPDEFPYNTEMTGSEALSPHLLLHFLSCYSQAPVTLSASELPLRRALRTHAHTVFRSGHQPNPHHHIYSCKKEKNLGFLGSPHSELWFSVSVV